MRKVTASIFCICLFFNSLYAQELSSLLNDSDNKINELYLKGAFKEAYNYVDSIKEMSNQSFKDKADIHWTIWEAKLNYEIGERIAFQQTKTVLEQPSTLSSQAHIESLTLLARMLTDKGDYDQADIVLNDAFLLLKDTTNYSEAYIHFLNSYAYNRELTNAVPVYKKAKLLQEAIPDKNNYLYLQTLMFLADTYNSMGDYTALKKIILTCSNYCQEKNLISHPYYGKCLELHGYHYYNKEKFKEAIVTFNGAKKAYVQNLGATHPSTVKMINNLAVVSILLQDYTFAEKNYLHALAIQKTIGEGEIPHGEVFYNLADLYQTTGRYEKSIEFSKKALAIFEKEKHFTDPQDFYGLAHLNIGKGYFDLKNYEKAEYYYKKADSIFQIKSLRKNLVTVKKRLGILEHVKKNYETSLAYYHEGVGLVDKRAGHKANLIALYQSIANNHFQQKKYSNALHYAVKAKKLCRELYGIQSPQYTIILNLMARIFKATDSHSMAKHYYKLSINNLIYQIKAYYPALNEQERVQFLASVDAIAFSFFSYATKNSDKIPELTIYAQDLLLALKGLGLEYSKNILASADENNQAIYQEWLENRKILRGIFNNNSEEQKKIGINIEELQEKISLLEKKMGWEQTNIEIKSYSFEEIKEQLGRDEVAIDFFQYSFGTKGLNNKDTIQYCALITKPGGAHPHLIKLCKETKLRPYLQSGISMNSRNYVTSLELNEELYHLIWEPINKHLGGVTTVHLSVTGLLHQVAFATLRENEQPLAIRFQFVYHNSLRDIVKVDEPKSFNSSIVLIGGADFDMDLSTGNSTLKEEQVPKKTIHHVRAGSETTRGSLLFEYLPETKKEVEIIARQLSKNKWEVNLFTESDAIEEVIKYYTGDQAPQILHIATHGFFLNSLETDIKHTSNIWENLVLEENPLFRSGLVFSGANAVANNKTIPKDKEDGILTAYEIYNMDLSNTELVVLSACDTGKGEVANGEGVFGLQRAFKVAGVDKLLISLWKVPDEETNLLMQAFYKNTLKGLSINKAFTEAQRSMIKQYPAWKAYQWGAFILLN